MRFDFRTALAMSVIALLTLGGWAGAGEKTLMEEMGFSEYPGSKLITEVNIQAGKLLEKLAKDVGPWLGVEELKEINVVVFGLASDASADDVWAFYEPTVHQQEWKTMVRTAQKHQAIAVLYKEEEGMLIVNIAPVGKNQSEMTIIRLRGKVVPEKVADPTAKLPEIVKATVESAVGPNGTGPGVQAARLPIGQPISVPPSEKLHLKATRSDIRAQILAQNTAEIRLASQVADPGELVRMDERLVLALTPKVNVDEVILPGAVSLLLELTEGSLILSCGPGPDDRPVKLYITATGAGVKVEAFPLVSGTHVIKTLGGDAEVVLSTTEGGSLDMEATGGDITLGMPRDISAVLDVTCPAGNFRNLTGADMQELSDTHRRTQMGAGKARISLKAVNGTVCIRFTD